MMPGYTRRGDYLVPSDRLKAAEEEVETWSEGRRARDRLSRAPIERDFEEWREQPRGVDYPGVDTPTREPRTSLLDLWHMESADSPPDRGDVLHDPEEPEPWGGSRMLGGLERASRMPEDSKKLVRDALRF